MYDDDDNDQFDGNGNDAVGQLRTANKAQAKQIKELTANLETATLSNAELTRKVNTTTLAELLTARGIDPGVSKFLKDVDPTDESVTTWLAENGKFIGYDPTKGSDEDTGGKADTATEAHDSPEMAELKAAMLRVQNQEANAAPGLVAGAKSLEALTRLDQNAKSFEDAEKGLRDLGIIKQ